MSGQFKKFTLTAAAVAGLGYLVGCGTAGNNTGFQDPGGGIASLGGSAAAAAAASTTTTTGTGGLTGGSTGSAVVNPTLAATVATGLTISNMLSTTLAGAGNSPTRLALVNFGGAVLGTRPIVVQGFNLGIGQAFVTILTRNPETTPGTSNIRITNNNLGTFAAPANNLQSPFGLMVDGTDIFVTNQFGTGLQGSVVRINGVSDTGVARFDLMGTANLLNPIDIVNDGNFLYVAEFQATGAGGQIRKINKTTGATSILLANVNFPSSLVFDTSNGRRLLYVAENQAGSSGANGGIIRVDLGATGGFVEGSGVLTGVNPSPGVSFINPQTVGGLPEAAYANPFDLAIDDVGNVIITEGYSIAAGAPNPSANQGRIRVIQKSAAPPAAPTTTSRIILSGLGGTRGPSVIREDAAGDVNTVFFTEGVATAQTLRQVTFRNTDAGIFRHLLLDTGKQNPLDTLFDAGTAGPPVTAANVKYTVNFNNAQGQVIDVR